VAPFKDGPSAAADMPFSGIVSEVIPEYQRERVSLVRITVIQSGIPKQYILRGHETLTKNNAQISMGDVVRGDFVGGYLNGANGAIKSALFSSPPPPSRPKAKVVSTNSVSTNHAASGSSK